jgi:hypothetical protein
MRDEFAMRAMAQRIDALEAGERELAAIKRHIATSREVCSSCDRSVCQVPGRGEALHVPPANMAPPFTREDVETYRDQLLPDDGVDGVAVAMLNHLLFLMDRAS